MNFSFAIALLTVTPIPSPTDLHTLDTHPKLPFLNPPNKAPSPPSQPLSSPPPPPTLPTAHQTSHPPSTSTTTSAPAPSIAFPRPDISWVYRRGVRVLCRLLGRCGSRVRAEGGIRVNGMDEKNGKGKGDGGRRGRVGSTLSLSRLDLLEPNLGSHFGLPLDSVLEPKPSASHIASSGFVSPSLIKGLKGKLFGGYGERAGLRRFLVERLARRFLMRHIL